MKKLSILLLGALGVLASSCDDKIEPSIPQQNPQGPILATGDIVSQTAGALASSDVLALEAYNSDGATVPAMQLVSTNSLPEGASVVYKLQLSNTEDFTRSVTLDMTAGSEAEFPVLYSVNAKEWNEAHLYLFGKSPKVKEAYYRVPVYVTFDGSDYRYESIDFYAAQGKISETCMDQGFVIEDHYYLLGNATTWSLDNKAEVEKFAFEHSADVSVYDDPVFTIKFEVTQDVIDANGGCYWKVAPESLIGTNDWSGVFGTEKNGDESLSGTLVGTSAESGKLTVPGKYRMTINMEEMTYSFELLLQPDVLYTPGGSNGWNQLNSGWMQLHSKDNPHYYGVFPISDGFKICAENNWDNATTYGAETDAPALSGSLVLGQTATNINVPENAVYWINVNFNPTGYELVDYSLLKIEKVGLIGSFAASAWGDDVAMTTSDNGATWTAEVEFAAGNEFKVRFNSNWDYNLGENIKKLEYNGANISVAEAGTYKVTLHLLGGTPFIEMVKK